MPDPIRAALSGLNASRQRQVVSANNIANARTPGYKASRADTASGPDGRGAQVVATVRDLSEGALEVTGNPLDLTIMGDGFFEVTDGAGQSFYTRDGAFQQNAEGQIVNGQGFELSPGIAVPAGAENINVDYDGTVSATVDGQPVALGQIPVTRFSNPQGLVAEGGDALSQTPTSGVAQPGVAGTGGRGTIMSGVLEGSNVDLAREIVNQLTEEKVFAANAAVIRTSDEMTEEKLDILS